VARKPTEADIRGRVSGSLQWRQQRGETGDIAPHIWRLSIPGAATVGKWELSYSSGSDVYKSGGEVKNGWITGVSQAVQVHRKVEKDWKMAYLARTGIHLTLRVVLHPSTAGWVLADQHFPMKY